MTGPDVGVVIVHYHRFPELRALVGRLHTAAGIQGSRIVICDNGSGVGEMEAIEAQFPTVAVMRLPSIGYGAAVNRGVEFFGHAVDLIFVATHELEFADTCLGRLVAVMLADPRIGIAGPGLWHSERTDRVWSLGGGLSRVRNLPWHERRAPTADLAPTPCVWVDGSATLIRPQAFADVGGYAEAFFLYFEDVEMGLARAAAGWSVVCVPAAVAYQAPGGHLDTRLAVRNLGWTLRMHGRTLAYVLWVIENIVRVLVGYAVPRVASRERQRARAGAVREMLTLPGELTSRSLYLRSSARRGRESHEYTR